MRRPSTAGAARLISAMNPGTPSRKGMLGMTADRFLYCLGSQSSAAHITEGGVVTMSSLARHFGPATTANSTRALLALRSSTQYAWPQRNRSTGKKTQNHYTDSSTGYRTNTSQKKHRGEEQIKFGRYDHTADLKRRLPMYQRRLCRNRVKPFYQHTYKWRFAVPGRKAGCDRRPSFARPWASPTAPPEAVQPVVSRSIPPRRGLGVVDTIRAR